MRVESSHQRSNDQSTSDQGSHHDKEQEGEAKHRRLRKLRARSGLEFDMHIHRILSALLRSDARSVRLANRPSKFVDPDASQVDLAPKPHIRSHMMPLTEFRTHIAKLLPLVAHVPERIVLTKQGRPRATVVSIADLEMIERFDARSSDLIRRDLEDVARLFKAAQSEGKRTAHRDAPRIRTPERQAM